jgi:integrase
MRDNVPTTPNSVTEPLRRHNLSKQFVRPSSPREERTSTPRTIPTPISPTASQSPRKFWVVPDRQYSPSNSLSPVDEAIESQAASKEPFQAHMMLQSPPYPHKTLPTYNSQAVALQPVSDSPFLVSETPSERNITSGDASVIASMTFFEASIRWLEAHKPKLRERAVYMYGRHLNALNKHFREMKLCKIHVGHLRDYQQARIQNRDDIWARKAGYSIINHEVSCVQQVLKMARLWAPISEVYEPLPKSPTKKKKVLDDVEERHLFAVAASRPEWELAFLAAKLTRNTTAAGTELRNLRFEDVILDSGEPRIVINAATAKNEFRGRTIPLNDTALATIRYCMDRARKLGSLLPEHYLFPKRVTRNLWDPYKPASTSWLRVSFNGMREAAGFPWLTPHCFRHMAITVMLEKGSSPETVRQIAGHVSEQMMRHYSHNRHAAQMSVLQAMDSTPPTPQKKKTAAVRAQQQRFMSRGRRRLVTRRSLA